MMCCYSNVHFQGQRVKCGDLMVTGVVNLAWALTSPKPGMGIDFTKTKVPNTAWISVSSLCEAMKLHFMKVVKTRFTTQAFSQSWAINPFGLFWQLLYLQQWPLAGMFMGRILCVQQQSLLFPVRSKQCDSGQAIFHSFTMWLNSA